MTANSDSGWIIIINPKACGGRGLRHWPRLANLLNYYNVKFTCSFTERRYHAVEMTVGAINRGHRKIAVFGGLGTFHEVVNGIFIQKSVNPDEITLGFIPILRLSGNNLLPKQYSERIKRIHNGFNTYDQAAAAMAGNSEDGNPETERYPVMAVNYIETKVKHITRLVLVGGIGFDAYANLLYNNLQDSGHGGKLRKFLYALLSFILYRSKKTYVSVDGQDIFKRGLFSGRIEILPSSEKKDSTDACGCESCGNEARISVSIIEQFPFWKRVILFRKIYTGKIYDTNSAIKSSGKRISIIHSGNTEKEYHTICADGETVGCSPVIIEYTGKYINLLMGKGRTGGK